MNAPQKITIQEDPLVAAPECFRALLENDRVRALDFRCRPGEKTSMLAHPACLIYSFNAATLKVTMPYGESGEYELKPGEVLWMKESTYATENIGQSDAHLLFIEMKDPR